MTTNVKRRGGHRALLTNLINQTNVELVNDPPDYSKILQLRDEINHQRNAIEEFDNLIQSGELTDDLFTKDIEESSQYRMRSGATLLSIENFIKRVSGSQEATASNRPLSDSRSSRDVKLPAVTLLTFDGSPLKWPTFWDLFKSSIHNRKDISGAAKFHYLIAQLRGDAKDLLEGFELSEAEYHEAISLLEETYGKPKLLVQARLHAILDLEVPEPTSKGLSKFRSSFEGHLRAIKALGCDIEASGYVYATILMRKLPKRIFDNINRANASDSWTLDDLRKAIDLEVNLLRATESSPKIDEYSLDSKNFECSAASLPVISNNLGVRSHSEYGSTSLPVTSNRSGVNSSFKDKSKFFKCSFCHSVQHGSFNCIEYDTYEKRQSRIKDLNLCYNCLGRAHTAANCKSSRTCRNCDKKHNTAICNKSFKPKDSEPITNNTSMTITGIDKFSGNLLPTAKIVVDNLGSSTHALFDTGSQKSFVVKSFAEKHKFPKIGTIDLALDGFENIGSKRTYDLVKIPIHTNDEIVKIDAIIVNSLPERISMTGRSEAVKILKSKNLTLADDNDQFDLYTNVNVLIGVDHFFKFVFAQRVTDDLYLIPSKLGNLVAGNVKFQSNSTVNTISTVLSIAKSCASLDFRSQFPQAEVANIHANQNPTDRISPGISASTFHRNLESHLKVTPKSFHSLVETPPSEEESIQVFTENSPVVETPLFEEESNHSYTETRFCSSKFKCSQFLFYDTNYREN